MKRFTLVFFLIVLAFGLQAQSYNVTFEVDMVNEATIAVL